QGDRRFLHRAARDGEGLLVFVEVYVRVVDREELAGERLAGDELDLRVEALDRHVGDVDVVVASAGGRAAIDRDLAPAGDDQEHGGGELRAALHGRLANRLTQKVRSMSVSTRLYLGASRRIASSGWKRMRATSAGSSSASQDSRIHS